MASVDVLLVKTFRAFTVPPSLTFSSGSLKLESVNEGRFKYLLTSNYVRGTKQIKERNEKKKEKIKKERKKEKAVLHFLAAIFLKVYNESFSPDEVVRLYILPSGKKMNDTVYLE